MKTRSGRGGYKPFLQGIARSRPRGRAVRLPERTSLPRTLSLEQVAAVIDCQERLRDRFLFALLASTGMRIGQALGLRHEDVVAWERRIVIRAREDAPRRARSKGGAEGGAYPASVASDHQREAKPVSTRDAQPEAPCPIRSSLPRRNPPPPPPPTRVDG